jgi:hypothetical protein
MGETVTITRRIENGTDSFGNPTYTVSTLTVDDVLVGWNTQGTNSEASRTPSDATITLYLSSSTLTHPNDVFSVRGSDWLYDGRQDWTNPFGGHAGSVIHLRQRRG